MGMYEYERVSTPTLVHKCTPKKGITTQYENSAEEHYEAADPLFLTGSGSDLKNV